MSSGPRIPVPMALAIARAFARRVGMDQRVADICGATIVGSLRRRGHDAAATVGDIEILCPMPGPVPDRPIATKEAQDAWRKQHEADDTVYAGIHAAVHPPQAPAQAEMFGDPPPPPAKPIGTALKGLKPCFMQCELQIFPAELGIVDGPEAVGVQVFRFWPGPYGNGGWAKLIRTGPTELGEWFLSRWKSVFNLPFGSQASAHGYLRDAHGAPVAVESETELLAKLRIEYIRPHLREPWITSKLAALSGGRR